MHRYVLGSFHAQAYLSGSDVHHGHDDIVANHDLLVSFPAQQKYRYLLRPAVGVFCDSFNTTSTREKIAASHLGATELSEARLLCCRLSWEYELSARRNIDRRAWKSHPSQDADLNGCPAHRRGQSEENALGKSNTLGCDEGGKPNNLATVCLLLVARGSSASQRIAGSRQIRRVGAPLVWFCVNSHFTARDAQLVCSNVCMGGCIRSAQTPFFWVVNSTWTKPSSAVAIHALGNPRVVLAASFLPPPSGEDITVVCKGATTRCPKLALAAYQKP
jgi:hypothetical protein